VPAISSEDRVFYLLEPDSENEGVYRHVDNQNEYAENGTSFYRGIIIQKEDEDSENITAIRVASVVQWIDKGQIQEVISETILTV